jgi:hypothetical protein
MTCVSKQVAYPEFPPVSGTWDGFVRVELYGVNAGDRTSKWIRGEDVNWLAHGSKEPVDVFLSGSDWLCVSTGQGSPNGSLVVGQKYAAEQLPGPPLGLKQYVAVRVDARGNIIGIVGTGGDAGSAITWASCWTSFTGVSRYS